MNTSIQSEIRILDYLSTFDMLIMFMIFFIMLAIAIIHNSKNKQENNDIYENLVMSRKLTLPFFVATLVPAWYGGVIAVSQIGFSHGLYAFITQGMCWYIVYIVLVLFLIKKIKHYHVLSISKLIQVNFGKTASTLSAIFLYFKYLPIIYAISLGIVINQIFSIGYITSLCAACLCICSYTIFSSLKIIFFNEAIQFIIMFVGIITTLLFSIYSFPIKKIFTLLPENHLTIYGDMNLSKTCIWLLIALSATIINPNFFQRLQAAKDNKTAQLGLIFCIILWLIFDLCVMGITFYAKAIIPNAAPAEALLNYSMQILPNGLKGLMLGSIIVTITSTYDAYIFNSGNLLFYDLNIFHKMNISFEQKRKLGIIISTMITIFLASLIKFRIEEFWYYSKSIFNSIFLIPVLVCYIYPRKFNQSYFFISLICTIFAISCNYYMGNRYEILYVGVITGSLVFLLNVLKHKYQS